MQTSIHINPCHCESSERHNLRHKELPHLLQGESAKNESWVGLQIPDVLRIAKSRYVEKVGRRVQEKTALIREGVVVISPDTTMDDLKRLAKEYYKKFGIATFQIHIHRDEGRDLEHRNLHAHLIFDWTNHETGKTIKLNRQQMAEMQTITAEVLNMERGKSSDIKHLDVIQYKNQQAELEVKEIEQKREIAEAKSAESFETLVKQGEEVGHHFDELAELVKPKADELKTRQALSLELKHPVRERISQLSALIKGVGQAIDRMGKEFARIAKRAIRSKWFAKFVLKDADFKEFATVDDLTKQVEDEKRKAEQARQDANESYGRGCSDEYKRFKEAFERQVKTINKLEGRLTAIDEQFPDIERWAELRKELKTAGITSDKSLLLLSGGHELMGKVDGKQVQISVCPSTGGNLCVWYDGVNLGEWRRRKQEEAKKTQERPRSKGYGIGY